MAVALTEQRRDLSIASLERTTRAVVDLVAAIPYDVPIPHMTWSVAQCVAHMVISDHLYVHQVSGPAAVIRIEETGPLNDWSVATGAGLSPASMAPDIASSTQRFIDTMRSLPSDGSYNWWSGAPAPLDNAIGLLVGERLAHGWDIARAVRKRWKIDPEDADVAMRAAIEVMPLLVDREAANGFNATFEMRLRGQSAYELRFTDGELTTRRAEGPFAADCRMSGDPATMFLLGYGRALQWRAGLTGKVFASGRKPWLALRLGQLLRAP